ncbi:hypothetical protein F2P79_000201 [Pimephales promelas]|nr:hypothetical protein F2P79_000201 [Pimephales promelas]
MRVDLGRQLQFPREIVETLLRPDLIMWSELCKTILLVELTVPWEEGMEAANEQKRAKYADLVEACKEPGWKATTCPVEVGCRGFVGSSTVRLLREMGRTGARCRKAIKELAEEAERGSFWLWLRTSTRGGGQVSSDYCERADDIQGRLEDIQERLDDCRKVCIGGYPPVQRCSLSTFIHLIHRYLMGHPE